MAIKKGVRHLREKLQEKIHFSWHHYEDTLGEHTEIEVEGKNIESIEIFTSQTRRAKEYLEVTADGRVLYGKQEFHGNRLTEMTDEEEIVWQCANVLSGRAKKPDGRIYTANRLYQCTGRPLKLASLNASKKGIYLEDIMAKQYCLAFCSRYQDPFGTKNGESKYAIMVDEFSIPQVISMYKEYPAINPADYLNARKAILKDIPKVVEECLWRNKAANDFSLLLDLQEEKKKSR